MTCREFKHEATSLGLTELAQSRDTQIVGHAQACQSCGAWMQNQRALAGSMQGLRARTAGLEAGPDVERALLRAFRQKAPVAAAAMGTRAADSAAAEPKHFLAAPGSTPLAWKMSRWFEVAAYAAVAAAIAVAIFLGAHLLPRHDATTAAQSNTTPIAQPSAAVTATMAHNVEQPQQPARSKVAHRARPAATVREPAVAQSTADDTQSDDAGYMALMLCDPLSCSSETQVVRMELPAAQGAQPQMADVVVGLDGIVRAVRFVD